MRCTDRRLMPAAFGNVRPVRCVASPHNPGSHTESLNRFGRDLGNRPNELGLLAAAEKINPSYVSRVLLPDIGGVRHRRGDFRRQTTGGAHLGVLVQAVAAIWDEQGRLLE